MNRLYGVLNGRLAERDFVAGDYSIADMAIYPWIRPHKNQGQDLADFPHVEGWYQRIRERPAVQRAVVVGKEEREKFNLATDEKARAVLFGQRARAG